MAQTSTLLSYPLLARSSGAAYAGEPHCVPLPPLLSSDFTQLLRPKSMILMSPERLSMIFSTLRSLWTTPALWICQTALRSCIMNLKSNFLEGCKDTEWGTLQIIQRTRFCLIKRFMVNGLNVRRNKQSS